MLGICAVIYFLTPHIKIILMNKTTYSKNKTPYMYVVPLSNEIMNKKIGFNKYGNNYSFCGIEFKLPYKSVTNDNYDNCQRKIKTICFDNNKSIMINNSEPLTPAMKTTFASVNEAGSNIYKYNDFDIYNTCLNITPDKMSIFSSLDEKTKILTLLFLKESLMSPQDVTGIYKYKSNNITGFRFVLKNNTQRICVFDNSHNFIVSMIAYMLSTEEINDLLSSFKITNKK